jgi:hypothetical protein
MTGSWARIAVAHDTVSTAIAATAISQAERTPAALATNAAIMEIAPS